MNETKKDLPVMAFESPAAWERWLEEHHDTANGIWIKMAKKASGIASINHQEALKVALCYGWIDGQGDKFDATYWLIKFTPRRKKSLWSQRNIGFVADLVREGKMKPAGLKEVESAKADGRWDRAYESPKNMTIPEDFLRELAKNREAEAFFETLNKTNRYAIAFRLHHAKKQETRERRMKKFLDMLAKGQKI